MNDKIKIAVFTSIRSEYGPLRPLLKKIKEENGFELLLVVGGAHLLAEFGYSKKQILEDGFEISYEIDFIPAGNPADSQTRSMGKLQVIFGEWLVRAKPDLLLVLGDRFELLPVVSSALIYNIPIAHISGGDVTEGAIDNQVRNAVTKMSHIHFPAIEAHKTNLLRMGEEDWRICVCGEPALDDILNMELYSKKDLFEALGVKNDLPIICCTFHPETINNAINPTFLKNLFERLTNEFPCRLIVTAANFDFGGHEINEMLRHIGDTSPQITYVPNLGQKKYYSLLNYASLMLGNSSSGIIEAQSFHLPVVNVGDRQKGRLTNSNVFHVATNIDEIISGVKLVATDKFRTRFKDQNNIYGNGNCSTAIIDFIKSVPFTDLLVKKNNLNITAIEL